MQLNEDVITGEKSIPDDSRPGRLVKPRPAGQRAVLHAQAEIIRLIRQQAIAPGAMLPGYLELARHCGVAPATVQRAIAELADRGVVRSESRRGTFLARALDPDLDLQRRADLGRFESPGGPVPLAPAKILTVGVVAHIPMDNPTYRDQTWAHAIVGGIEAAAAFESRVTIRFINTWRLGHTRAFFPEALEALAAAGVDGQIFIRNRDSPFPDQLPPATTVFVSDDCLSRPVTQVYYDSAVAGYQAASHLIEFGYRRLLFAAPFADRWVGERLAGVRDAVDNSSHKITLETFLKAADPTVVDQTDAAYQMAASLLTQMAPATAIIAANDAAAYGIARAAAEAGLEYGRDFGLIGFDDRPRSREMGLTSLRPPLEDMGKEALRLLLASLRNRSVAGHMCLTSNLARRLSTRAVNAF